MNKMLEALGKFETKLEVSQSEIGSNALEAISKGTTDGLRLAVNVGAMLLVFIGLMSMANYILFKFYDIEFEPGLTKGIADP